MIKLSNVSKVYNTGSNEQTVLNNLNFNIEKNGLYAICGSSGSGKSTLLNIIGLLEKPTSGDVEIYNQSILSSNNLDQLRHDNFSFVFQEFNLLQGFTVLENLELVDSNISNIDQALEFINLSDKKNVNVNLLSGGEKQRVAIARALLQKSNILLLDEPTGSLDEENTDYIFKLLKEVSKSKIIIVVTHDIKNAYLYSDEVYLLKDGKLSIDNNNVVYKSIFIKKDVETSLKLYKLLENYNNEIEIYSNVKKISYKVDDLFVTVEKIINDFENEEINIKYSEDNINIPTHLSKAKKEFNNKFILKYSFKLINNKIKWFLSNLILITLTSLLFLLYFVIVSYDKDVSLENALNKNGLSNITIEAIEYNKYTDEYKNYKVGSSIEEKYGNFENYKYFNVFIEPINRPNQNMLNTRIFIVDDRDSIVMTDFLYEYLYAEKFVKNKEVQINTLFNSEKININIEDVIETNYDKQIFNSFVYNKDYMNYNLEQLYNKYCAIYIPKTLFLSKINNIRLYASNFFKTDGTTNSYVKFNPMIYSKYNSENIIYGSIPNEYNEIVVSQKSLRMNNITDFNSVIGKEFQYKDIRNIRNNKLYLDKVNMYDLTKTVKVVGVTSDVSADCYIDNNFYNDIKNEAINYLVSGTLFINVNTKFIKLLHENNDVCSLDLASSVYLFEKLVNSPLKYILLFLGSVFSLITILSLYQYVSMLLKTKYNEIGILRTLGKTKKQIYLIFIIHVLFLILLSSILTNILGYIVTFLLNNLLKSEPFFDINYNLLNLSLLNIFLPVILISFLGVILTIIPLRINMKKDINLVFKTNK